MAAWCLGGDALPVVLLRTTSRGGPGSVGRRPPLPRPRSAQLPLAPRRGSRGAHPTAPVAVPRPLLPPAALGASILFVLRSLRRRRGGASAGGAAHPAKPTTALQARRAQVLDTPDNDTKTRARDGDVASLLEDMTADSPALQEYLEGVGKPLAAAYPQQRPWQDGDRKWITSPLGNGKWDSLKRNWAHLGFDSNSDIQVVTRELNLDLDLDRRRDFLVMVICKAGDSGLLVTGVGQTPINSNLARELAAAQALERIEHFSHLDVLNWPDATASGEAEVLASVMRAFNFDFLGSCMSPLLDSRLFALRPFGTCWVGCMRGTLKTREIPMRAVSAKCTKNAKKAAIDAGIGFVAVMKTVLSIPHWSKDPKEWASWVGGPSYYRRTVVDLPRMGNDNGEEGSPAFFVQAPVLSHSGAMAMLSAAVARAESMGRPQCVAIVEASGELLGEIRMTGTSGRLYSESARAKARLAACTGWPSRSVPEHVQHTIDPRGQDGRRVAQGGMCELPGGLPIKIRGTLVGAIGVASGTPEQDVAVAQAALSAVGADA